MFPRIATDPINLEASRLLSRKDGAPDPEKIQQLITAISAKIAECDTAITSISTQIDRRGEDDANWARAARLARVGYIKQRQSLRKTLATAREGMVTIRRAIETKAKNERLKLQATTALQMRALNLREKTAKFAIQVDAETEQRRRFAICFRRACREIVGEDVFQSIVARADQLQKLSSTSPSESNPAITP